MVKQKKAFTIIEVLVVMSIIALLAVSITYISRRGAKEKAYLIRAQSEVITIANAIKLKVQETGSYPTDVDRALPAGIESYIATPNDAWPTAPWPNTVYDYDNWDGGDVVQVSVRFCAIGQDAICKANAQKYLTGKVSAATLSAWDSKSSVYFCIKESTTIATHKCRSHQDNPITHPGLRIDISSAH